MGEWGFASPFQETRALRWAVLFRPIGEWQFYILDLIMYIGLRFFPGAPGFGMTILDSALEFMPYIDTVRE